MDECVHRCSSVYLRSCRDCEDMEGCVDYVEPPEEDDDVFFKGLKISRYEEDDYI